MPLLLHMQRKCSIIFELSTEWSQLQPVLNVNKCHFYKSSTKERKKKKCIALIQNLPSLEFLHLCCEVGSVGILPSSVLFLELELSSALCWKKKGKMSISAVKMTETRGCSSSILAHQLVCGTMGYAQERDLWSSQQSSNKGNISP